MKSHQYLKEFATETLAKEKHHLLKTPEISIVQNSNARLNCTNYHRTTAQLGTKR
jgi:hypothetical protein